MCGHFVAITSVHGIPGNCCASCHGLPNSMVCVHFHTESSRWLQQQKLATVDSSQVVGENAIAGIAAFISDHQPLIYSSCIIQAPESETKELILCVMKMF